MKGGFVLSSNNDPIEKNIYADKSALVLDWLLREGITKKNFSLRAVVKEVGVSIGLVQRVFNVLVLKGFLQTVGVRTAKRFSVKKPKELLESWLEHYSIVKKCKIRTYRSALSGKSEWFEALKRFKLNNKVILALHSAALAYGYKNTNLEGLELYVLENSVRKKLEKALQLEPQERGYEVLLIEPYYKSLINQNKKKGKGVDICPLILAFLDLYHFPLRGQEQAEFISMRAPEMKSIYKAINK